MFPLEHLLVALLPVGAYVLIRDRRPPSTELLFAVFVGSQFPDLVDKPLAYWLGVIPSGRVFTHSVPVALPIVGVVLAYGWRTGRPRIAGGFVVAYVLHLVGDTYRLLARGRIPSDLLWPLIAAQPRPDIPGWAGVNGINVRIWTAFSLVVLSVTLVVVVRDGWLRLASGSPDRQRLDGTDGRK